jgi:ubiquinone/menaquinone biosynthesis C-methylase UbiE
MSNKSTTAPDLKFSEKYDAQHAEKYFHKHNSGFWRTLSTWRERQIARKALTLAGDPKIVLDIPCGTGRFWGVLAENSNRIIYAADNSLDMINTGLKLREPEIVSRINKSFQASAFDISLEDNAVDCVLCLRLIHHMGDSDTRIKLLQELCRVTSSSVIISLWVDGNFQAWKRKKREQNYRIADYQNRFLIPAEKIESEFLQCGLQVEYRLNFTKYHSMWRTYVLQKIEAPYNLSGKFDTLF